MIDSAQNAYLYLSPKAKRVYLSAVGVASRLGINGWPSVAALAKVVGTDELDELLGSGLFDRRPDGSVEVAGSVGLALRNFRMVA